MSKVKAFECRVYRPAYDVPSLNGMDATNGGISGRKGSLYMRDPFGTILIDGDDERLLRFVQDAGGGDGFHLEPVNGHKGKGYTDWTFGGNITEVRRHGRTEYFRIHDRQEIWEQYETLSR